MSEPAEAPAQAESTAVEPAASTPVPTPTPAPKPPAKPLAPRNFARLVLALSGSVWLALGIVTFFDGHWVADLADFELTSNTAEGEFRAMYGGMPISLAVLHLIGATRARWLPAALMLALGTTIGMFSGRLFGLITVGVPGALGLFLLLAEVILSGLLGAAIYRMGREAFAERRSGKAA